MKIMASLWNLQTEVRSKLQWAPGMAHIISTLERDKGMAHTENSTSNLANTNPGIYGSLLDHHSLSRTRNLMITHISQTKELLRNGI
jgi:hypothetical protein